MVDKEPFFKKVVRSKHVRYRVLKWLSFIPDPWMIRLQYLIYMGRFLSLRKPERFSEKLQWYKLYYRDPLMTVCADKCSVRSYVESLGLSEILVTKYAEFSSAQEVDLDLLPNSFVMKFNIGAKRNILVKDKRLISREEIVSEVSGWFEDVASDLGREWAYYNITPKIIVEEFLESDSVYGLIDYKFFCFDGKPDFLYVMVDRFNGGGLRMQIYNAEFHPLNTFRQRIGELIEPIAKPKNYEAMLDIARSLSSKFPHVRVDLYNIEGRIYFGELTFYDGSGYIGFNPEQFDFDAGSRFKLPEKRV